MANKKIYEDVLDSLDKIEPSIPEEDEDNCYPIFRDGYACTFLVSGPYMDIMSNAVPDVLKVYLDEYSDDYRMTVLSSGEDLSEFAAETGRNIIAGDDDRPYIAVQFNAPEKDICRLLFMIFSTGGQFTRYVRENKRKWQPVFTKLIYGASVIVRKRKIISHEGILAICIAAFALRCTDDRKLTDTLIYQNYGELRCTEEYARAQKVIKAFVNRLQSK